MVKQLGIVLECVVIADSGTSLLAGLIAVVIMIQVMPLEPPGLIAKHVRLQLHHMGKQSGIYCYQRHHYQIHTCKLGQAPSNGMYDVDMGIRSVVDKE